MYSWILVVSERMLCGDDDASLLDRYRQITQEQVRQEYLRAIPKLGI
jgi:hypothetical protein